MFNGKTNNSENSYNQSSYVYQIGKGLLLFGGGILGYLGLSKIFSSEPQDEHNQVSTDEIAPYKSNKLTLNNFESTFESKSFSTFNSNPAGRKLLSIDDNLVDSSENTDESQDINSQNDLYKDSYQNSNSVQVSYRGGDEFQVNTYTDSGQGYPSVSSLSGDRFVVVWQSYGQDGSGAGVYGRIFNGTGHNITSEFQVNTYTDSNQYFPLVGRLSDDRFVVFWQSDGQGGRFTGVYGRIFNATGYGITSEFQVSNYTDSFPSVSSLSDDRFVVVWESNGQGGSYSGVYGRLFNGTGHNVTAEFQVNTYTDDYQNRPYVSRLSDDRFVVVWQSYGQDGSGAGVYGLLNVNYFCRLATIILAGFCQSNYCLVSSPFLVLS